jgi:hypothetical protein
LPKEEHAMYRFIRTVTVKAAKNPAALQWAGEITAYLNKTYSMNATYGMELFGAAKIHWYFDTDSLDKFTAMNAKMMQDREYLALVAKGEGVWIEGAMKDTIVALLG